MGSFTSRQNVEIGGAEEESSGNNYKYPPRNGANFFGSHFIMGGERFDTPQPEAYLFGENADLNFLGSRPTAFPYPPPQANEPTKTLKSLVNIRKESVRFIRIPAAEKKRESIHSSKGQLEEIDGNVLCGIGSAGGDVTPCTYNIEFTFDSDAKCAITIYYFCTEEITARGVTLVSRDGLTSDTYHFEKGINQCFSQPGHVFNPQLIPEDDLIYNAGKEQYPVAIHCVVEEGNEDARQSHTTICVIDHHPESNSYVLRALKQKIFVDGLCYLLQEIYGIENKAVNKSSIDDEELDDHGSECVICMSETRDTLILPCRHLCLCNSCADSLRYQANNCPICRSPFRALLQIRAVQKGVIGSGGGGSSTQHAPLHQNTPTGAGSEAAALACDQHLPAGYIPVSLIEALNGPPQFVAKVRTSDDATDGVVGLNAGVDNHKATSPLKPNAGQQRQRSKVKKVSTSTNTSELGNTISNNNTTAAGDGDKNKKQSAEKADKLPRIGQDKLQIVNERHSLKLPKTKRSASGNVAATAATNAHNVDGDEDSENEKLSPLLSPTGRCKANATTGLTKTTLTMDDMNAPDDDSERERMAADDDDEDTVDGTDPGGDGEAIEMKATNISLKKQKRPDLNAETANNGGGGVTRSLGRSTVATDDSDYYTPEDTQHSILSPLCPERAKSAGAAADKLAGLQCNTGGSFKSANAVALMKKKNLHKKSTSVGNIAGPQGNSGGNGGSGGVAATDLKGNVVSSLPDMLDKPIVGANSTSSTRSSSDSYSSSSSTKQLLSSSHANNSNAANNANATSSNNNSSAANIVILDDKTALQNAVNV